jgi:hypothetical protein
MTKDVRPAMAQRLHLMRRVPWVAYRFLGEIGNSGILRHTKLTMNSIAILLLSNADSRVDPMPSQLGGSGLYQIWASVLSKKSLRAFIRDILDLISSGSLAEAAS